MSDSLSDKSDTGDEVFTVHTFPVLDTGVGKSLGFKDDKEFMAHALAEREKLSPATQEAMEKIDREVERKILGL